MIYVNIYRNNQGQIYGFIAQNHGEEIVCAAVSALIINAVNSIEEFTDEIASVEAPIEEEGYIEFHMPGIEAGNDNRDVDLLLSSMLHGLKRIQNEYPDQIFVND